MIRKLLSGLTIGPMVIVLSVLAISFQAVMIVDSSSSPANACGNHKEA